MIISEPFKRIHKVYSSYQEKKTIIDPCRKNNWIDPLARINNPIYPFDVIFRMDRLPGLATPSDGTSSPSFNRSTVS